MSENSQEDLDSSLVKLESTLPTLVTIQNQYWKSSPQFQALLSEGGLPDGVKATSSARRFTPQQFCYLRIIYLYSDTPEKLTTHLKVQIKVPGRDPYTAAVQHNQFYAYVWIQSFCEWFEISSDTILLKPQIKRMEIHGASQEQLVDAAKDIEATVELKRTIEQFKTAAKTDLSTTLSSIIDAKTEQSKIEENLFSLDADLQKIKALYDESKVKLVNSTTKLQQTHAETKHLESKAFEAKNNTDQLAQEAKTLNNQIAALKSTLQRLTSDKNLISDEYGPYVEEGKSQATIYSLLIIFPLTAIIFSVYQVYVGAGNLLTTEFKSATDVIAAFMLRIPFAAIFGLAILYSWKLAYFMIQKIFKIHSDRLTLAKLLVVARETVHSSAKNLNISDYEKFQEQTALKIEVLKSHMARDLSEDFTYKPVSKNKTLTPEPQAPAMNDDEIIKDDQSGESRL
ncbi:hypothetical protein [Pseudomonas atacamensis]|uniref:hypothetical protein n=1 Tax=Pseudomonas atacamensis TaxID=2565368 RepID=UPI00381C39B8